MTRYSVPLIVLVLLALAAVVGPAYGDHIALDWPKPAPSQDYSLPAIILADRAGGLELVSAPITVPLTLGHVAYLPVEVQNYHRPITVSAQTLIHTYINDRTPAEPGASPPFVVGVLDAAQSELKLQTLRMREHTLTLSFQGENLTLPGPPSPETELLFQERGGSEGRFSFDEGRSPSPDGSPERSRRIAVRRGGWGVRTDAFAVTVTLAPAVQPRTPLFSIHTAPYYDGIPEPYIRIWGMQCDY